LQCTESWITECYVSLLLGLILTSVDQLPIFTFRKFQQTVKLRHNSGREEPSALSQNIVRIWKNFTNITPYQVQFTLGL